MSKETEYEYFRRINPKCPYCSHESLYFYAQRPIKIRCANCERRFNATLSMTYEKNPLPIENYYKIVGEKID